MFDDLKGAVDQLGKVRNSVVAEDASDELWRLARQLVVRRVRGWREDGLDVYVYFDNDSRGRAPYDALGLLRRLG